MPFFNTSSATYIQAGQRGLREEQAAAVEAFKRLADAKEALMDPESSPAKRMREEQNEAPSPWSGGDERPARRQRRQRRRQKSERCCAHNHMCGGLFSYTLLLLGPSPRLCLDRNTSRERAGGQQKIEVARRRIGGGCGGGDD